MDKKLTLLSELQAIYEMANIGPKTHRFGIDIKLNILQPGDKQIPHEPRVKLIKRGTDKNFSIMLNEDPEKMELVGDYSGIISTKEYNILLREIKKYRIPFLNMWFDSSMDQDELREQMDEIDAGKDIPSLRPKQYDAQWEIINEKLGSRHCDLTQ